MVSFGISISRYFQNLHEIHPQKMEIPKARNLPLEFLVRVRVSEWELWVWPWPKRLPHGLIQALHGGVLGEECSLECGLKELLLLLCFLVNEPTTVISSYRADSLLRPNQKCCNNTWFGIDKSGPDHVKNENLS